MPIACITGASRGIGLALAKRFLNAGYDVCGTSRAGTSSFSHERLTMLPLEITNNESREKFAQYFADRGFVIDVLVNNAGIWHPADEEDCVNLKTLQETLDVNVLGTIDITERLLAGNRLGKHIINISSRRGSMTFTETSLYPCYAISKAALNMYTRLLAGRFSYNKIISAVHPGVVQTDMNDGRGELTPEESAEYIYQLTVKDIPTGQFWYKGEIFPW